MTQGTSLVRNRGTVSRHIQRQGDCRSCRWRENRCRWMQVSPLFVVFSPKILDIPLAFQETSLTTK